ncbi:MAG: homoserine dehydrogenase [Pseudohongiellaceae bacterium]
MTQHPTPKPALKIGICGLGTVGGGTLHLLQNNHNLLTQRTGIPLQVVHIASRNLKPNNTKDAPQQSTDPFAIANDPNVDVLVETIGGNTPAFELITQALQNHKHVVTANKALLAEQGNDLFKLATQQGVQLLFESAVAGGIPIIKALREGLAANHITRITGIINGTANFILSAMTAQNRHFNDVLTEAQQHGYAEANPTFDIEGTDAAHKLTLMAAIAFGIPLQFAKVHTEGITHITPEDITHAAELGYSIKHLGITEHTNQGISMRVHPALIPHHHPLSHINGVNNAILIDSNPMGTTLYTGPGAGAEATASAVVADLIDLGRHTLTPTNHPSPPPLGYHTPATPQPPVLDIDDIETTCYLRLSTQNKPDAMAQISTALETHNIGTDAIIQKEAVNKTATIIILTHKTQERRLNDALATLKKLDGISGDITRIRMES